MRTPFFYFMGGYWLEVHYTQLLTGQDIRLRPINSPLEGWQTKSDGVK